MGFDNAMARKLLAASRRREQQPAYKTDHMILALRDDWSRFTCWVTYRVRYLRGRRQTKRSLLRQR